MLLGRREGEKKKSVWQIPIRMIFSHPEKAVKNTLGTSRVTSQSDDIQGGCSNWPWTAAEGQLKYAIINPKQCVAGRRQNQALEMLAEHVAESQWSLTHLLANVKITTHEPINWEGKQVVCESHIRK